MNIITVEYGHFRMTDDGLDKKGDGTPNKCRYRMYNRRSGIVLDLNKQEYDYIRASKSAMMACIEVERWYEKKGKSFDVV